jgi:hypothetical protein
MANENEVDLVLGGTVLTPETDPTHPDRKVEVHPYGIILPGEPGREDYLRRLREYQEEQMGPDDRDGRKP